MAAFYKIEYSGGDLVLAVAPAPARPRAGGGRFLIIIGLLVAVAAGGGVFLYGTLFGGGGGGGVLSGGNTVVVAAQAIPVRHQITEAELTTLKVSPALPNTYVQSKDGKGLIAGGQSSISALAR